ncbi:MAG: hypothetical protein WBA13_23260 [Microcoleaceae cyanobacterium]
MTLQELQDQILQLSISDRWRLVQTLLNSIQQEMLSFNSPNSNENFLTGLDPWTQSLIGVIQLDAEEPTESYVDYLEEKYR